MHIGHRTWTDMSKSIPVITLKQVSSFLGSRPRDSHKGQFGTVIVIGGATGMIGAPLLAARAALKMGAGCVHVEFVADNAPVFDPVLPELMLRSMTAVHQKFIPGVLAIGCGMGTSSTSYKLLYEALKHKSPIVMDADALNLIAYHSDLQDDLRARVYPSVITPHPGEAARLLGCSSNEVQADRVSSVLQLSQKFKCSVLLKGANSLCATLDGKLYLNQTGNSGMSSAGMGDVLTGMIAAFVAQGLNVDKAILLATYLHGAAGDKLASQGVTIGMTASDLTEWARWLLNQYLSTRKP